jgi:hypothetical protein
MGRGQAFRLVTGGRDERTYLTVSFMFPGAKGDPLELVVMSDVPS